MTTLKLTSRRDDWDELTELVEALAEYLPGDKTSVYAAVQAIAEGEAATVRVDDAQVAEFTAHMQEFDIRAEAQRS